MKSVDTNIVVRAMTDDHAIQSPVAKRIVSEGISIVPTVLLEVAWVLRSSYGWTRADIVSNVGALLSIEGVTVDRRGAVEWALQKYAEGADLADMLHLALSDGAECFATFDQSIARHAADSPVPVETL